MPRTFITVCLLTGNSPLRQPQKINTWWKRWSQLPAATGHMEGHRDSQAYSDVLWHLTTTCSQFHETQKYMLSFCGHIPAISRCIFGFSPCSAALKPALASFNRNRSCEHSILLSASAITLCMQRQTHVQWVVVCNFHFLNILNFLATKLKEY